MWDLHVSKLFGWVKGWWKECPFSCYDFAIQFEHIHIKRQSVKVRIGDWIPPPEGFLKFNVDGSSKGNPGASGIGGLLRKSHKVMIDLFSMDIGIAWAYEVKVKAILSALKFCKHFAIRSIIIESDSSLIVG